MKGVRPLPKCCYSHACTRIAMSHSPGKISRTSFKFLSRNQSCDVISDKIILSPIMYRPLPRSPVLRFLRAWPTMSEQNPWGSDPLPEPLLLGARLPDGENTWSGSELLLKSCVFRLLRTKPGEFYFDRFVDFCAVLMLNRLNKRALRISIQAYSN